MLKGKDKAIPEQAWAGPEVSMRLRGSLISRQSALESGKFLSPTHRPPLLPENIPCTNFC